MADFEGIIKQHAGDDGSIPASAIGSIVTAIKQTVGNEFVEKERYKAKLSEIDTLKEQSQTAGDAAMTAEKWKTKYDALRHDFEQYKADQAAKETRAAKEAAYREILKDAEVPEQHFAKVLKYSDVDSVELDADGKAKNAKELLKAIKEEWSDHIPTTTTQGASTATPPEQTKGATVLSVEEIKKIEDTSERQQAWALHLAAQQQN